MISFSGNSPVNNAQYYAESRTFAGLFGIPATLMAADYSEFTAYAEAMFHSDILNVSAVAQRIAANLRRPRPLAPRAGELSRRNPGNAERLRRDFGLSDGDAERRISERAVRRTRWAYPLLLLRLRRVAPYHEARERLAGQSARTIPTQLLNRLSIGQTSLAD
jgi:hypothetical protein